MIELGSREIKIPRLRRGLQYKIIDRTIFYKDTGLKGE